MNIIEFEEGKDYLKWREGSGNTVEIFDIAVNSHRRRGQGRRLINHLINRDIPKDCKLIWAITRADNQIAQLFYEEMNFRVIGVLRYFYSVKNEEGRETIDAIMYGRDIKI